MAKAKKQKKRSPKPASSPGWFSSDSEEIDRRRMRGANEPFQIEADAAGDDFFGFYGVQSEFGQRYRVEIRSLAEAINSCNCPDHRVNRLGTCKHIEATLHRLQHRRKRAFQTAAAQGSPYIEIFLDQRDLRVRILWPAGTKNRSRAREFLAPFFHPDNTLTGAPLDALPAIQRTIDASHGATRRKIRVSAELTAWLETLDRRAQLVRSRQHFETQVAAGKARLDLLKHALYPYQREGMLHLAFTGRALLADEMGLGKTVQAVAACELLRQISGIKRVLVVCPASLKGEWEEQIGKFTDLPSRIIQGSRARRLQQYQEPTFFYLANYEQIRADIEEINTILAPDVIILDEAQRIKNWQTQTATAIKRLKSPYAFVLTGTPVENRIDEIYSIVQFLDPTLFGPLFRFNRDFYQLDEKGRAIGYKNLDQLHQRLGSIMLRRRKEDVEGQLPGRTINTYFVPMAEEQQLRYGEYETMAARLAHLSNSRPLSKEEMERLQRYLACMRMLCDTPYILDQECRISPKLEELTNILQEIVADGDHKIIIFSEWQRMLELVREQVEEMGLGYAWHTGKVPQDQRRKEIRRFREDAQCRLFLSTDSGALGLNLQVADVVINLDLPWNPAKLEQRIARAWRKHQKRPVQVINLVSEHTIEHRMLPLLEQKRALAEGIVDGVGDAEMALPSGRAAFLERVSALVEIAPEAAKASATNPAEQLKAAILPQWQQHLDLMQLHSNGDQYTLMVVAKENSGELRGALTRQLEAQFPDQIPQLTILDRDAFAAMQQLLQAGILSTNETVADTLYQATATATEQEEPAASRQAEALAHLASGLHRQRMAMVLGEGGFAVEALNPMREAVEITLQALFLWRDQPTQEQPSLGQIDAILVQAELLPTESLSLIARVREELPGIDEAQAEDLLEACHQLIARAQHALEGQQFSL